MMYDGEYEPDETAVDSALHPDKTKQDAIWINIGSEYGGMACLVIPIAANGHVYFANFSMDTDDEINEVISMLEASKGMVADYRREYWDELGLPPPDAE
jgi:hypothetical protein